MRREPHCADCGGWDIEWMYKCHKHGLEYCGGCSCPECDEEDDDDYGHDDDEDDERPCSNLLAHDRADEVPCPTCGELP